MTGYGAATAQNAQTSVEVELKSANSRHLDLIFRLPRIYTLFENDLRAEISQAIERGRIEVSVNRLEKKAQPVDVRFNRTAFLALQKVYRSAGKELGCSAEEMRSVMLSQLLNRSEVIEVVQRSPDISHEREVLFSALKKAMHAFDAMRSREGSHLAGDISERLEKLVAIRIHIAEHTAKKPEQARDRLVAALKRLAGEAQLDISRLHAEAALLADKVDVTEELVRLESHLSHFETLLSSPPAGKKMDFLVQELVREFNTIGSKAQDAAVQRQVIEAKSEIEKIREQVQNLE